MDSTVHTEHHSDKQIFDIYFGFINTYTLFFADEVKLFDLLEGKALRLGEIGSALELAPRAAQALVAMCTSQGLLEKSGECYGLTSLAQAFLTRKSETSFSGVLQSARHKEDAFSYAFFKESMLSGESGLFGETDLFENNAQDQLHSEIFTKAMHSKSKGPARAWSGRIDLSGYSCLLDVGGGSGVHSICALEKWPELNAVIFDLPYVCDIADTYVEQYRMAGRITTHKGDIWASEYPAADVHLYSDIFHDWPLDKCLFLAKKSFDALPSGGRIILHEMFFNKDKTGPHNVAAYNANMLLWTQGQQLSETEISELLTIAGFRDITVSRTQYGDWSLATGIKY